MSTSGTWPFTLLEPADDFDEASYVALLGELRGFLDAFAGSSPDPAGTARLAADLRRWRTALAERHAPASSVPYGQLHGADDHGLAAVPAVEVHTEAPGTLDATVRFSRWYVGGGGAVHGGHLATTIDGLMGRTQMADGWIARTARLDVSYRALTPVDEPVHCEIRTRRTEGRKSFLHGRLFHGSTTYVEAEALFVRVARYPGSAREPGAGTLEAS
ncbi:MULTISPECIES: hypothetical protein [unclassified Nocardioides]|uniref:hypothetical protein n=1 Tax=unclassified Nocardioides TaxID=2615069 RepID=UPI000702C656|nr:MULTISPECIES: hypothetical protein [unclassified Nocardioides]KRC54134.1 hypothetical protein ASE19_08760 [Nocardioides sp. Root79]KRC71470.1 hypothetical protein ASE20_11175 [Nocardioides sp. Root240]